MVLEDPTDRRNYAVAENGESPLDAMQRIDHLTNDELAIVIRDGLNGELHYFKYADNEVWLHHCPHTEVIASYWTDTLPKAFDLRIGEDSDVGVIPVDTTPLWGDGTFEPDDLFN